MVAHLRLGLRPVIFKIVTLQGILTDKPHFVKRILSGTIFKNISRPAGKKTLALLFLILYFSLFTVHAQDRAVIDSLKNELKVFESHKKEMGRNATPLMDSIKANLLHELALKFWTNKVDTSLYYSQQLLALSQQIGYTKGVGAGYNMMGLVNMAMKNYAVADDYYRKSLKIRTDIGDKTGMAWTCNNMGLMYGNLGEMNESIKWHTQSLQIKKEINDKPGMASSYGKIGHDYTNLGDFPKALNNYLNALKIWEEDSNRKEIGGVYLNIGNLYYSAGNYPEALINYRNELKIADETGDKEQIAYADVNMGRICYKQGNDSLAINYLQASLKILNELGKLGSNAEIHYNLGLVYLAMGKYPEALNNADSSLKEWQMVSPIGVSRVSVEIGSIYEKQGRFQDALESATKGLTIAKQIQAKVEIKDAYNLLADINAAMHNYEAAYYNNKEYSNAADSLSSNENAKKVATLEMNYTFQKKEDSASAEQEKRDFIKTAESKRKSIITGSAVVISILTLLMALLFINRQQLKRKKDAVVFENEKQRIEIELANAKTMLDEYIQSMEEKNKLLEEFKADVEGFKNLYDKERIEKLEYLNKATILTEEDWNKFKQLFDHVHKDFFKRLKEKLPDLTQSEMRLICLTKLAIGTKQMAGILGVSFDTIKKSRHRLRKKLGLPEEDSLDDVVNSI